MKTSVAMPSSDKRVRVGGIGGMVDQILLRLLTERSNVDDLLSIAAINCRNQAIALKTPGRDHSECYRDFSSIDLTGVTDTGVYSRVESKSHESHPCLLTGRNIRPLLDPQLHFICAERAERSRSVLQ